MPVIKVSCLPEQSEDELQKLWAALVRAVEEVPELNLKGKNSMTILFPTDAMKYGLGEEIIIEVIGLFERPDRTEVIRKRLAVSLATAVAKFFPNAMIECFIIPFNPANGFFVIPRTVKIEEVKKPI